MSNPEHVPRTEPHPGAGARMMLGALRERAGGGALVVLGLLVLAAAVLPAAAMALPEGRVYEQVSPVYKGGYGAGRIEAVAQDGERVAYFSPGAFAGAPAGPRKIDYVARRGASGWSTTPVMPPAEVLGEVNQMDVTPTLGTVMDNGKPGPNENSTYVNSVESEFVLHSPGLPDTSPNWEVGGMGVTNLTETPSILNGVGGNADFCHLLFEATKPTFGGEGGTEDEALLREALGTRGQFYDLARGCDGEPVSLHLVAVNNRGQVIDRQCRPDLGISYYSEGSTSNSFNAISADGKEIFFTTCVNGKDTSHYQLFVRLDATRTLEVSRPLQPACGEVPCGGAAVAGARASASFAGASEDGSRVFFSTAAPLIGEDRDLGDDLYVAQLGCLESEPECSVDERTVTSLVQVSHASSIGEAADVQGVLAVAPDGSRAYFVARGALGTEPNAQGAVAVKGADNLYVYNAAGGSPHGSLAFVGDLCSGDGSSGAVADVHCPSGPASDTRLWVGNEPEVQTGGPNGRFLVFSCYAQLTGSDTDTAKDVYRYDAGTGELDRVSGGETGSDANGNNDLFDATITDGNRGGGGGHAVRLQYEMNSRAISEDGSRIVFGSSEPLSPAATNGLANVYEWHAQSGGGEGSVSLISGGSGEAPVEDVVISPSGNDIFFTTAQGLVAQDTDGAPDVYDARLNGGFPASAAPVKACAGDACQGPLTNPAALLIPGSVSQTPEESLVAAKHKPKAKKKRRRKRVKRQGKDLPVRSKQ